MQYNTIASTKSALTNVLALPGIPCISAHPLIERFLKGVYNLRPPNPRYSVIWDTAMVIDYLRSLPNNNLSIKLLFYKKVMLLTLSGQCLSTLYHFQIDEVQSRDKETIFNVILNSDYVSGCCVIGIT